MTGGSRVTDDGGTMEGRLRDERETDQMDVTSSINTRKGFKNRYFSELTFMSCGLELKRQQCNVFD